MIVPAGVPSCCLCLLLKCSQILLKCSRLFPGRPALFFTHVYVCIDCIGSKSQCMPVPVLICHHKDCYSRSFSTPAPGFCSLRCLCLLDGSTARRRAPACILCPHRGGEDALTLHTELLSSFTILVLNSLGL